MKNPRDVREDIKLNLHELDLEWEKQPMLMEYYSKLYSQSMMELAVLKIDYEASSAERKLDFRLEGEIKKEGDDRKTKITEGALDDLVNSDEHLKVLKKNMAKKQYEVDTLKGVVEALRNKKSALEREVELYIAGYFSAPKDQRTLLNQKRKQGANIKNE